MFKNVYYMFAAFILIWFTLLSISTYAIVVNSAPLNKLVSDTDLLINFFQRLTGFLAFNLLFFQILTGSLMPKLRRKLGSIIFKFHLIQGALAYSLIIMHPLLFIILNFRLTNKFDPFYVFTDFCVLCSKRLEYFYTLGRISFWLITSGVVAAKLRSSIILRKNWRRVHVLNYLAFFLVSAHAYFVGTDIKLEPTSFIYFTYITVALILLVARIVREFKERS